MLYLCNMKEKLNKFIIDNEENIRSLSNEEKNELAEVFLKQFEIIKKVKVTEMTLQQLN